MEVRGRVRSIALDSCRRVTLVCDSTLGEVELTNCQEVKVSVRGRVAAMSIDRTDGAHVFLESGESRGCEFTTAGSSNMLVSLSEPDGYTEFALPEQFKMVIDGGSVKTTAVDP